MNYINKLLEKEESYVLYEDDIYLMESGQSHIIIENLYPKIESVLNTPQGDRMFKRLVGEFMDKNNDKLHTSGPVYLIPFMTTDQIRFLELFKLSYTTSGTGNKLRLKNTEVNEYISKVIKQIGSSSDFKLLNNNPMFWVLYCCIRFYTLKKDQKGINTALAMYALADYPLVFSRLFPYGANEAVMQYTIDNLTDKFIIKKQGNIFGALFESVQHSYEFLKSPMIDGSDKEIIRWIQRIRNDHKSMLGKICDKYMENHAKGLRVTLTKDAYDEVQIDVDAENKTSKVENVGRKITIKILTNDVNLKFVSISAKLAGISISESRFYISKLINDKYTNDIERFIESILFLYLYDENKNVNDINSKHFLLWSEELFRKTNANNDNIQNIKTTLDKWAEETGVHNKYKREASRVAYKKAIFFYFIFSIQNYNN